MNGKFLTYTLLGILPICFFTGCAPREKTLLLPDVYTLDAESEDSTAADDFTVKKIYTYSYETNPALDHSASLKNCDEHEVFVIANEENTDRQMPLLRQVDYRYGFYDTSGQSKTPWEEPEKVLHPMFWRLWSPDEASEPKDADAGEDFLYGIDKMLLSPDGKKMLVYARAESWDNYFVWLYDFETQTPYTLYQGTPPEGVDPKGSFSPSGRWAAFDATGSLHQKLILLYDCHKDRNDGDEEAFIPINDHTSFYPPDDAIPVAETASHLIREAGLFDRSDRAGLLTFVQEYDQEMLAIESYNLPPDETDPLYTESSYYLYGMPGHLPYFRCALDTKNNHIYYLNDTSQMQSTDLTHGTSGVIRDFSGAVLDFLLLDSGDFLLLSSQDANAFSIKSTANVSNPDSLTLQKEWDISSMDLYLYATEDENERLLYKNLHNVICMEYDETTRRILVETSEDGTLRRRQCVILEL